MKAGAAQPQLDVRDTKSSGTLQQNILNALLSCNAVNVITIHASKCPECPIREAEHWLSPMRIRDTFLLHPGEAGIDPSTVEVGHDYVKLPDIKAAEEWKATFGLYELPEEVYRSRKVLMRHKVLSRLNDFPVLDSARPRAMP